jgi:hypothetical protein
MCHEGRTLYVTNIGESMDSKKLQEMFSQVGIVTSAQIYGLRPDVDNVEPRQNPAELSERAQQPLSRYGVVTMETGQCIARALGLSETYEELNVEKTRLRDRKILLEKELWDLKHEAAGADTGLASWVPTPLSRGKSAEERKTHIHELETEIEQARPPKLTVAFSQSSSIPMMYRVVGAAWSAAARSHPAAQRAQIEVLSRVLPRQLSARVVCLCLCLSVSVCLCLSLSVSL